MSVLGGYISNLGMGNTRIQSHNSVEGLIRSALGNRFIESSAPKEQVEQIQESEKINHSSINSTLENVNEVLKQAKTQDISERILERKGKSLNPPIKKKKKKVAENKELSPFQKSLLLESYSEFDSEPAIKTPTKSKPLTESESYDSEPRYESPKRPQEPASRYEEEPESLGPIIRRKEYIFHRDSDETFECKVNIEGGSQESNKARLFLKTDVWNLTFDGSIRKDGTCQVPLKKLTVLPEGTTGTAFLEIIVDDVVFIPWESPFRVGTYKRVSIQSPSLSRR
jgi:hypothetical protein